MVEVNMASLLYLFGVITAVMAVDNDAEMLLREGNREFTARMYTEVAKQHPGHNIIQSAYSVLTPLAQLSLASVGESHDELLKTIGLPNDNVTKEAFSNANKRLRTFKGIELKMANKVYIPNSYHLNEQFADVCKEIFDAEVQNIDFQMSEKAANTINAWVEEHTNKRIKDLIDPKSCNSDTQAFLINAIYFKGTWKQKFNSKLTKDRDFHVSNDETIKIPFMHQTSYHLHGYSKELDATLIQMFYEGEDAHFLIILPAAVDGLTALEEKLRNPTLLKDAISNMTPTKVDLYLPKFKIETTTDLKTVLQGMSVTKLFNKGEAKLINLLKEETGLYVSEAKQKAFIEVNEEGAEAAAANGGKQAYRSPDVKRLLYLYRVRYKEYRVRYKEYRSPAAIQQQNISEFGMLTRSSRVEPTVTFDANRPFIFAIKSGDTEIFTGRYVK